jgi:hypothetical protein
MKTFTLDALGLRPGIETTGRDFEVGQMVVHFQSSFQPIGNTILQCGVIKIGGTRQFPVYEITDVNTDHNYESMGCFLLFLDTSRLGNVSSNGSYSGKMDRPRPRFICQSTFQNGTNWSSICLVALPNDSFIKFKMQGDLFWQKITNTNGEPILGA